MIVTEKLDGTNATIHIEDDGTTVLVGSRKRWITPENDNFGFARWVHEHMEDVLQLGPGTHRGEWWGLGIQRGYGLQEKRFSLFNTSRWNADNTPPNIHVVPVLYVGIFDTAVVDEILRNLHVGGSVAAPGFTNPEGVVVYHTKANVFFKKTLDHNDDHKFMTVEDPRR